MLGWAGVLAGACHCHGCTDHINPFRVSAGHLNHLQPQPSQLQLHNPNPTTSDATTMTKCRGQFNSPCFCYFGLLLGHNSC